MKTAIIPNPPQVPVETRDERTGGNMKLFYTILFFLNTLLLIALTFLFLGFLDTGKSTFMMAGIALGIVLCIVLLCFFLSSYMKLPPSDNS